MLGAEQLYGCIKYEQIREPIRVHPKSLYELALLDEGDLLFRKNLGDIVFDGWEDGLMVFYEPGFSDGEVGVSKIPLSDHITMLENGQVHIHQSGWDEHITMNPSKNPDYVRRRDYLQFLGLMKNEKS